MAFRPDIKNHTAPEGIEGFLPQDLPTPEIISKQGWNAIRVALAITAFVVAGGGYMYYFGK